MPNESGNAACKRWREKHPRRLRNTILKNRHGITIDEWDRLIIAQLGRCAICSKPMILPQKEPAVDHDHDTGKIRALLCFGCNVGLGSFKDSLSVLKLAVLYLESFQ